MFKPSKELVDFIKKKEALRLKPYKDFDGTMAVGYGDTENVTGPISEQEAEQRLIKRLERDGQELAKLVQRDDLTQGQIDATLDVMYNVRRDTLLKSGFFDKINKRQDQEVYASLGSYTKARNKQGQLVELPGLVDRSKARQQMWGQTVTPEVNVMSTQMQGASDIFSPASGDVDLASAVASLGSNDDLSEAVKSIGDMGDGEIDLSQAVASIGIRKEPESNPTLSGFSFAGELNDDPAYVESQEKARAFARKEGITPDEAEALTFEQDPKLVSLKRQEFDIVKFFPELAQWGSDPVNYKKIKENPDAYKKVVSAAKRTEPSFLNDLSRVAKDNWWQLENSYLFTSVIMGISTPEEVQGRVNQIEIDREANPYTKYAAGLAENNTAWEKLKNTAQTYGPIAAKAVTDIFTGEGSLTDNLKKLLGAGMITDMQAMELTKTLAKNPGALLIEGAQSVNSLVTSQLGRVLGMGTGAALGLPGGPAGVAAGATAGSYTGAALASFLLEFGGQLQTELEEFRDPISGFINLKLAVSDPKRVARWKALAAAKAGPTAVLDSLFAVRLGNIFSAPAKAATRLGRVAEKTGQALVGGAVDAAGEGGTELAGQVGRSSLNQFYGVPYTLEAFIGQTVESSREGVSSVGTSTAGTLVAGTVQRVSSKVFKKSKNGTPEQKAKEQEVVYQDAKKAEDAYEMSQALRQAIEENPELKNDPEALRELINQTRAERPQQSETNADDIDLEAETNAELSNMMDDQTDMSVSVTDFNKYFEAQGIDPLTVLATMPQEVINQYNESKGLEGSFTITKGDWYASTLDYPNIDAIVRFGSNTQNALEATQIADEIRANPFAPLEEIVAYHGSPYKFDTFSTEAIGTGEGVQWQGWGLYFSSNKDVAEWYRQTYAREGETGQTYEVRIKSDKEAMIDLDQPLDEAKERKFSAAVDKVLEQFSVKEKLPGWKNFYFFGDQKADTASSALRGIQNLLDQAGISSQQSERAISEALLAEGVPGFKYQGGGLAQAEGRTGRAENYVIFSDQDVEIAQTFYEPGDEPPLISGEVFPDVITDGKDTMDFITVEGDANDDLVSRPVMATAKFKNTEEQKLFKKLASQFRKVFKGNTEGITPERAEAIAELEFERMKARARQLGVPLAEVMRSLEVGKSVRAGSFGYFKRGVNGQPSKIAYRKDATIKTAIHELGHSWLHELSEDYVTLMRIPEDQRTDEQKELLVLMDVLAKEYQSRGIKMDNIGELYNRDAKGVEEVHEIFSQTTERWAFEGTFENNRLKFIMDKFREWLTQLGNIINRSYPQYPSFEMTPELKRLFTVLTNADEKVTEQLAPMFQEKDFPDGFLGPEEDRLYNEAYLDARSEAIGSFIAKGMHKSFREREEAIRKVQAELYAKAQAAVDARPSMQILKSFEDAVEMYKRGELSSDPRISEKSFRETLAGGDLMTAEKMRQALPKNLIAKVKGGGMDVLDVMERFGITSPEVFLEMLTEAGKRDEFIEAEFDRLVETEMPVFKSDAELHKEAVDALSARGREKLLDTTFKIMMEKFPNEFRKLVERGMLPSSMGQSKDIKKLLKQRAATAILKRGAEGFNPLRLLAESDRLGKEAASMFRSGDIEGAMELKYKQAELFYQAQAGFAVAKEIARVKALRKYINKKWNNADALKNDLDVQLMQYAKYLADQTLKDFSIQKINKEAINPASGVTSTQVDKINEAIDIILQSSEATNPSNRTVATDLAIGQAMDMILAFARNAKKVEIAGKKMNKEKAVTAIVEEIGEKQDYDPQYTRDEVNRNSLKGWARLANLESLTLDTIFSSLFKNPVEYAKSTLASIMNSVKEAEAKYSEVTAQLRESIYDAGKRTAAKSKVEFIKGVIMDSVVVSGRESKPYALKNMNVSIKNKADLLMFIAIYRGSESGAEALSLGGIYDQGAIGGFDIETGVIDRSKFLADEAQLIKDGLLTKEDFDFIQSIYDAFEKLYPDVKRVARQVEGREIGYVEATEIKNELGTWRGGYIPLSRGELLPSGPDDLLLDPLKNEIYGMFPVAHKGNLESRTRSAKNVDLDLGKVLMSLNSVARFAYMYPVMSDVAKIFTDKDFVQALEARRPGVMANVLRPWFQLTQSQRIVQPDASSVAAAFKMLRHRIPLVYYTFKIGSALKQPLGILQAIPAMGIGSEAQVARAMGDLVFNPIGSFRAMREAKEGSIRLRERFSKSQRRVIQDFDDINANFSAGRSVRDMGGKLAFILIQTMTNITETIIYNAALRQGMSQGMTDKQAEDYALNILEKTQGNAPASGLSALQSGNEFKKLVTAFSSVPITLKNVAWEGMQRERQEQIKFAVHFSLWSIAAVVYFESLIDGAGGEDEEKRMRKAGYSKKRINEIQNMKMIARMSGQVLDATIPVFGRPVLESLIHRDIRATPSIDTLGRAIFGTVSAAKDVSNGIELDVNQIKAILDLGSIITGYPLTAGKLPLQLNEAMKSDVRKSIEKSRRTSAKRRQAERDKR